MVQTLDKTLTIEEFLRLPETKPTNEFVHQRVIQKPTPQGEHSTLQSELVSAINATGKPSQIAYDFPELRCIFGGAVIVPDVCVFRWPRIPRTDSGHVANKFESYPDWAIEILSPEQAQTKPLEKLLHCVEQGAELGWLVDPASDSILTLSSESKLKLYRNEEVLPVLSGLELSLSAVDVFSWLSIV